MFEREDDYGVRVYPFEDEPQTEQDERLLASAGYVYAVTSEYAPDPDRRIAMNMSLVGPVTVKDAERFIAAFARAIEIVREAEAARLAALKNRLDEVKSNA